MSVFVRIVSRLRRGATIAVLASIVPLMAGGASSALAYDITSMAEINVTSANVALQSHDPVAYFTVGKPVLGQESLSAEHEGAVYRFSSEENLAAFKADPAKYAPLHGGFCQQGAAGGRKLDGDPNIFRVADGKLAVYSYPAALKGFLKDPAGNAAKAEANWATIKDKTPKELF